MSTVAQSENATKPATGRVTYKVAGEAQRQAHARAVEAKLIQRELRVLDAVIDFTASFSKLSDDVYVEAIQEAAGLRGKGQYSRTCAILRKLDRLGIISYEGSTMRKEPSTVSLPAPVGGAHTGLPNEGGSVGSAEPTQPEVGWADPVQLGGLTSAHVPREDREVNKTEGIFSHELDESDPRLNGNAERARELLEHLTRS